MECEWLFCFEPATVEVLYPYPSASLHWFCPEHATAVVDDPGLLGCVTMQSADGPSTGREI